MIKYHKLGSLNNRRFLLPTSGGWKFKIQKCAGLVSAEAALTPSLQMAALLLLLSGFFFLCICTILVS